MIANQNIIVLIHFIFHLSRRKKVDTTTQVNKSDNESDRILQDPIIRPNPIGFRGTIQQTDLTVGSQVNSDDIRVLEPVNIPTTGFL